jgi:hypothetical protein
MKDMDRLLRDDARIGLPDEGFSARVMNALPAAQVRERPWLKPALVMGSAALGSVLAAALSPAGGALLAAFNEIAHLRIASQGAIAALALCGALLLSALVLATDPE